jgi:hypothetical protein
MATLTARKLCRFLGAGVLACGVGIFAGPGHVLADSDDVHVCSGTPQSPGVLAGSFDDVVVRGFCAVNGGVARVHGDLVVSNGSALAAAFALNDVTGSGTSSLRVDGDLQVRDGATLVLGCDASSFPCLDDPNPTSPTLSSPAYVGDNLSGDEPLGILVHDATINGDVSETGGGGGTNCTPQGPFAGFMSPVFSAFEDSTVGDDVSIHGYDSCWLGLARLHVAGDVTLRNNQLADPDAIEVIGNTIKGDLSCHGNSMVWDGHELGKHLYPRADVPNTVGDDRSGQCVRSTPTTKGGPYGPPGSF